MMPETAMVHFMIRTLLPLALLLSLASACTVIHTSSNTHQSGVNISNETLAQLEVGKTTKSWVVATLGPPSSLTTVDDKTEILKYTSTRTRKTNHGFLLVIDTKSESEEKETVFLEFQTGVLKRYWKET